MGLGQLVFWKYVDMRGGFLVKETKQDWNGKLSVSRLLGKGNFRQKNLPDLDFKAEIGYNKGRLFSSPETCHVKGAARPVMLRCLNYTYLLLYTQNMYWFYAHFKKNLKNVYNKYRKG